MDNYFEVLELSMDEIQGKDEAIIQNEVNAAHIRLYALTIGPYAPVPRPDGSTQAQWQGVLNEARDTLIDPQQRRDHIAQLNSTKPIPTTTPAPTIATTSTASAEPSDHHQISKRRRSHQHPTTGNFNGKEF